MTSTSRLFSTPKNNGFAIVSAIFLLVTLAALGAFMLTYSNTQQLSSAQDLQGSRAYQAARGGMQWAIGRLAATSASDGVDYCATQATATGANSLALDGFTVSVTCTVNIYTEGSDNSKKIYRVESTASAGGAVGSMAYVERSLSGFVEFAPP